MRNLIRSLVLSVISLAVCPAGADEPQGDFKLHQFDRQQLTDTYYSEGVAAGDIDGDGQADIVYGPYWFAGPEFTEKHEIYEPVAQDRSGYADNFFSWIHDFDGDGASDVFVVGFPGTPAHVYENPGSDGLDDHWEKHEVFDWVSNESPQLVDLVGDKRPELVCTREGFFGFVTVDWEHPFQRWQFHPISGQVTAKRFGHGLGIGDINGDDRADVIHAGGWFEQPEQDSMTSRWRSHAVSFSPAYGGAEMYAYDVDGDGDNDVITSHAAHDFGLGWYEQRRDGNELTFQHHQIMGEKRSDNRYGVLFSEPHSVELADIDGDGLKDIVTGKTYYSHHQQSPMWDAGAVVYWFQLVRDDEGVHWVPHQADDQAGIGRQLVVEDVNADQLPDLVVGGMKGAHLLKHRVAHVDRKRWQAAQPKPYQPSQRDSAIQQLQQQAAQAKSIRGARSPIDQKSGMVPGAVEGESLEHHASAGNVVRQPMGNFRADQWSGNAQLWWKGAKPGDVLTVELPNKSGQVDLELALTCAKDYGVVQLSVAGEPLGPPIDCYASDVVTTGVLSFENIQLKSDQPKLQIQILGANPKAKPAYMVGIDYVRLTGKDETPPQPSDGVVPTAADGRRLNLDFETGTLKDWTAEGEAFADQPVQGDTVSARRGEMRSAHRGNYWIGGYEKHGDAPTGTLTSASFEVTQPYGTFLVGGGGTAKTRVELVREESGDVIYNVAGKNSETMRRAVVDLRAQVGKKILIRLVDEASGGWGHVNFDHFRLRQQRPGRLTAPLTELVEDEYPHAGLSGREAAEAMKLPDGFHVTVGATEPNVKQPIAMALDNRGRVWVAEAYEYPQRADGGSGRDRILIFEDTDGNGSLDKQKVFAEGLNLISGLEVGFGGVWVGAAPYLMFIPDADGDDVPDSEPEILLDGWGYQDTHETLNTFTWGPDGWLYGCHGVFTHSRVGKPGTPDDQRTPINAGIWRYHPTRDEFEVFAHGTSNPWGIDFDDHGQAFATACVIPHLFHVIHGARYQRQAGQHFNPHTYRDIVTIADHLHYLGNNPHRGNRKSDAAGGGHAHSGAMVYLGGKWPERYRNQIIMNNIHGQRLNMDLLQPQHSGFVGSHGPDFLLTGDEASQILNFRYGPDGNVWMIDWYDMQACHRPNASVHDRSNGRIYKISYGESSSDFEPVDLTERSDRELAEMVLRQNDWYVRHARRLLQYRAAEGKIDPQARQRLVEIASTHNDDTRVLRALWALHVSGGLSDSMIQRSLGHASPYVRGWTIEMTMERLEGAVPEKWLSQWTEMAANDPSPVVRLYLASAAGRMPLEQRWNLVKSLCSHGEDTQDHNLPLMYWYAAEPLAEADPQRALALAMAAGDSIPLVRQFMLRRIGSSGAGDSLAVLIRGLGDAESTSIQQTYLEAIRAALRGQRQVEPPEQWNSVYRDLMQGAEQSVKMQATALGVTFGDQSATQQLRKRLEDRSAPVEARRLALEALLDADDPGLASTLQSIVQESSPLRAEAIRGLAQYDSPETASVLVAIYPELDSKQKRLALGTLCSRSEYAVTMLMAIEEEKIPSTDLSADLVRQLQYLENDRVDRLLESVWGRVRETAADKQKLIARYKQLMNRDAPTKPEPSLGRAVFAQTCMKCHVLYGVGDHVGPDLTGSNRSKLDYLLSNIVDPSAVMAKEYQPHVILTVDGRVVTGLIESENDNALTLKTADSVVTIPKDEIEARMRSDQSMMPEDQLRQFTDHQVRSLLAYLQGKSQVPMQATPQNVSQLFNGEDLSGWSGDEQLWSVENGQIVGRSEGLKRNHWLVSDMVVEDFRLSLEVKLLDNAGNSGIQFRSESEEGHVSGYQADIGAGWWGKLYEEHGRGLLWEESAKQHVKPGQWNHYEIVAEGDSIQTFINGHKCVDLNDPQGARRGILALQLHSGGPTEVRFRDLKLEVLGEPEVIVEQEQDDS